MRDKNKIKRKFSKEFEKVLHKIEKPKLEIHFIPIICSAPLIYAKTYGYFEENGLSVVIKPSPGWSGIKDVMAYERVDAAHMLAPMPFATSMGLDGKQNDLLLLGIQNVNGQALTLSNKYEKFKNLKDLKGLTFGVPYKFSMHYYLLCYYLANNGVNPLKDVKIKEVAPPRMPYYLKKGWVDGVFAPEPFNQIPVNQGTGFIHILSKDIWPGHPCCTFSTSKTFANDYPNTMKMMIKSVLEAQFALHKSNVKQKIEIAKELCAPGFLSQDDPIPVIQALTGDFPDGKGNELSITDRIDFIPWNKPEYGAWILSQMQRWSQLRSTVDYSEIVESVMDSKLNNELAELTGFKKSDTLHGVSYLKKDGYSLENGLKYMKKQPFSNFREKNGVRKEYTDAESVKKRLTDLGKIIADISSGREVEKNIAITSDDQVGVLEQMLNDMITNLKYKQLEVIEKNEELEQEIGRKETAEEELKTANQQLRASELQLKAVNQQLEASNRQIRAREKKLENTLKVFVGRENKIRELQKKIKVLKEKD